MRPLKIFRGFAAFIVPIIIFYGKEGGGGEGAQILGRAPGAKYPRNATDQVFWLDFTRDSVTSVTISADIPKLRKASGTKVITNEIGTLIR